MPVSRRTLSYLSLDRIIAKRVPDWAASFIALLWDQADVMGYVSYVWRDSNGKLKHAR